MFSYIVGLVAVLVLFHDPISQLLSSPGAVPQIRRTPRPRLITELLALEDDDDVNATGIACPPDAYSLHIFSREPLVLYVEGFLSAEDRAHLLGIRYVTVYPSVALLRFCCLMGCNEQPAMCCLLIAVVYHTRQGDCC